MWGKEEPWLGGAAEGSPREPPWDGCPEAKTALLNYAEGLFLCEEGGLHFRVLCPWQPAEVLHFQACSLKVCVMFLRQTLQRKFASLESVAFVRHPKKSLQPSMQPNLLCSQI